MAFSKTSSLVGQVLTFDDRQVYMPTTASPTTGVLAAAVSASGANVTSPVLNKATQFRVLFASKQPNPPVQGQPANSWGLPNLSLMTTANGVLDLTYFQFIRRLLDNSGQDPASALALKLISASFTNFNNATQQPYTTPGAVQLEAILGVANVATGALVDLETTRYYDLQIAPELLFDWYTF